AAGSWAALLAPAARHRLLRGGLALLVVGWAALAGWRAFSIHHLGPGEGRAPFIRTLAGWIEGAGAPARVAILSGHVVDYMPAVYLGGGAWSLPDPSLWQLAAFGQRGAAAATERARFLDELLDGLLQA